MVLVVGVEVSLVHRVSERIVVAICLRGISMVHISMVHSLMTFLVAALALRSLKLHIVRYFLG